MVVGIYLLIYFYFLFMTCNQSFLFTLKFTCFLAYRPPALSCQNLTHPIYTHIADLSSVVGNRIEKKNCLPAKLFSQNVVSLL